MFHVSLRFNELSFKLLLCSPFPYQTLRQTLDRMRDFFFLSQDFSQVFFCCFSLEISSQILIQLSPSRYYLLVQQLYSRILKAINQWNLNSMWLEFNHFLHFSFFKTWFKCFCFPSILLTTAKWAALVKERLGQKSCLCTYVSPPSLFLTSLSVPTAT